MKTFVQGLLIIALAVLVSACAIEPDAAQPTMAPALAAPTMAPTSAPPTLSPTLAPTAVPTQVADETTTIQQVIQRGNEAQVQAIAERDPSTMAETATSDHFRQLTRVNEELLGGGVTRIALLNLEWGPISVDGAQATATTWETWRTTYEDGTTEQSRDRNEYVLVRQGGAWRVQSNSHPGEPAGASNPRITSPTPSVPGASIDARNTSTNWSGYAAGGGKFTGVGGTWIVPEFNPDRPFGVDAAWVGIGGVRSRDLIQAGTSQTITQSGSAQYQAWVETLPEAAEPVPLAVHPGDTITVSITEQEPGTWLMTLLNETTGEKYERTETYPSSYSSAEWIQEAPSTGRGRLLPLSDFGTVSFTDGWAIKDGERVTIGGANARPITMIGADNQALAVPSELGDGGTSFSVARTDAPANMGGRQRRGSRGSQAAD